MEVHRRPETKGHIFSQPAKSKMLLYFYFFYSRLLSLSLSFPLPCLSFSSDSGGGGGGGEVKDSLRNLGGSVASSYTSSSVEDGSSLIDPAGYVVLQYSMRPRTPTPEHMRHAFFASQIRFPNNGSSTEVGGGGVGGSPSAAPPLPLHTHTCVLAFRIHT
jgi:hypothetical protein